MTNKGKKVYPEQGRRVFVGMSGGVDSSVSAALLQQATANNFEKLFGRPAPKGFRGYDVTGVFMKVWQPDFLECSRGDDRREAMRAAAHLDIPFLTFDFEKEYKEAVVDYMVREYKEGRTPNPDVMCNKHVKFGVFLKKAREMGADYIATGHYARHIEPGVAAGDSQGGHLEARPLSDLEVRLPSDEGMGGKHELLMGTDKKKDQTYFLWTMTQDALKSVLFPVGGLEKPEVRNLARKFGLPNAGREESQGVCFMGEFTMKDFLEHYIPKKKGDVLNESGEVIGWHDGSHFLTLGQRHGFTVTKKTPNDEPYYIIAKDVGDNTITVGERKNQEAEGVKEIIIKDVNFVSGTTPPEDKAYTARIRYRQPLQKCTFMRQKDDTLHVIFEVPQSAVASGQSLVLYDGEVCLGGGIIV